MDEKELKNIIICPNCETINKKKNLKPNEIAVCRNCEKILYQQEQLIELKIFSLVISGIIFFIIAMFFPIVNINILGYSENLKIFNAIFVLFQKGYIFISLFVFFTVFLFPLMCSVLYFIVSFLLLFKYNKKSAKKILTAITIMKDWCFLDIFFIAILVSLIKIFSYANVVFDIGFIAYLFFLTIMFYIMKFIGVNTLWEIYENI